MELSPEKFDGLDAFRGRAGAPERKILSHGGILQVADADDLLDHAMIIPDCRRM